MKYTEKYRNPKHSFHVAVSASLAKAKPALPELIRAIAQAPGSSFLFYLCERKLDKLVHKKAKTTPTIRQRAFALCKKGNREVVVDAKKAAPARISPQDSS